MPSQSIGASKPGLRITATRRPATPSSMPARQSRGSSGRQFGSRRSKRAIAPSIRAASRTVRVIGPATATGAKAPSGHCGTRPKLGFSPTTPHHAAGMRIEPPASVPTCSGPKQAAAAAPAPAEEPPGVMSVFQGLRVMPCSGQSPGLFQPYSVVVVLPTITAPAARSPVTSGASSATAAASVSRLPRRVGSPATSTRSLTVTGTPSSSPSGRPARQRAALSPAASSARGFITAKALSLGFSRAMRSVIACNASSGLSVPLAYSASKSSAGIRAGSVWVMSPGCRGEGALGTPRRYGRPRCPRPRASSVTTPCSVRSSCSVASPRKRK